MVEEDPDATEFVSSESSAWTVLGPAWTADGQAFSGVPVGEATTPPIQPAAPPAWPETPPSSPASSSPLQRAAVAASPSVAAVPVAAAPAQERVRASTVAPSRLTSQGIPLLPDAAARQPIGSRTLLLVAAIIVGAAIVAAGIYFAAVRLEAEPDTGSEIESSTIIYAEGNA